MIYFNSKRWSCRLSFTTITDAVSFLPARIAPLAGTVLSFVSRQRSLGPRFTVRFCRGQTNDSKSRLSSTNTTQVVDFHAFLRPVRGAERRFALSRQSRLNLLHGPDCCV